jgi:predicted KAP-like P-loop ATPase
MRIFLPELDVGPEDGFDPQIDIFKRAELGKSLTNIVTSITDPIVVALDGQWGSGKTTFLKMWAGELRKAGIPVILFDAFSNDYTADAFTALAGEIIGLAEDSKKSKTSAARNFTDRALSATKIVLRSGLKVGVKAATMGALEAADLQDMKTDASAETSKLADEYIGSLLTRRNEEKATISAFRQALSELPKALGVPQKDGDETEGTSE